MDEYRRLVLDANIMVSAVAGTSFPLLVRLFERGVVLMAAVQQWAETRQVLVEKMRVPTDWADAQIERLSTVVMPVHPAILEPYQDRAIRRLRTRGGPDWPVLAATYATGSAAWSHDKDLFGTGAAVWSTGVLAREIDLLPVAANGK
jgi:hypothetical protein